MRSGRRPLRPAHQQLQRSLVVPTSVALACWLGGCGVVEVDFIGAESTAMGGWSVHGTQAGERLGDRGLAALPAGMSEPLLVGMGSPGRGEGGQVAIHQPASHLRGVNFEDGLALLSGSLQAEAGASLASLEEEGVLVVGAPGEDTAWLLDWRDTRGEAELEEVASSSIHSLEERSSFGSGMTTGDIDGDGHLDLLVGATDESQGAGVVYLFPSTALAEATSTEDAAWSIEGYSPYDGFGAGLLAGMDLNGDGYGDMLLCAGELDVYDTDVGGCALVYGAPNLQGDHVSMWTTRDAVFVGSDDGDRLGSGSVGVAVADVDSDGAPDVVLGVPGSDREAGGSGAVAVFLGGSHDGLLYLEDADLLLTGTGASGTTLLSTEVGLLVGSPDEEGGSLRLLGTLQGEGGGLADLSTLLLQGEPGDELGGGAGPRGVGGSEAPGLVLPLPGADDGAQDGGRIQVDFDLLSR